MLGSIRTAHVRAAGGALIAAVGVWGVWTASAWRPEDGLYPMAVFALVALFGLVSAFRDLRERSAAARAPAREAAGDASAGAETEVKGGAVPSDTPPASEAEVPVSRDRVVRLAVISALTLAYVLVWDLAGYAVPTVIYTLSVLLTLGVRSRVALVAVPLGVTSFILVVFGELLSIPFP